MNENKQNDFIQNLNAKGWRDGGFAICSRLSALNCVQMDGNVDKLVGGRWGGV